MSLSIVLLGAAVWLVLVACVLGACRAAAAKSPVTGRESATRPVIGRDC
jgi:hypothetical protein